MKEKKKSKWMVGFNIANTKVDELTVSQTNARMVIYDRLKRKRNVGRVL